MNRAGEWAKKHGLKALIIDMPSGVKITIPLDKEFDLNNTEPTKQKYDDNFTI